MGPLLLLYLTLSLLAPAAVLGYRSTEVPGSGSGCTWLPGLTLDCSLRKLSADFWNYTLSGEQVRRTLSARIACNDQLLFESYLHPNQNLFQLTALRALTIESCKVRRVPRRLWLSLGSLQNLTLRSRNGDWSSAYGLEFESGALEGLGGLERLDLSWNNIWSLPADLLCPLRGLRALNLSSNSLTEAGLDLEGEACGGLGGLLSLDLTLNRVRRLGRNGFHRLRRLADLRLGNNLLEEVEDSAFFGLGALRLLNLSSNRLVALPPTLFDPAPGLRELHLANNSLSALSPAVFRGLGGLLLLDLSANSLTSLWVKDGLFGGLLRLIVLRLSGNQLSYIEPNLFSDLISLQALHLDGNRIENIDPAAFAALANLHLLDLSRNRLTFVDARLLSSLVVLRQLYLDHNKIRRLDDSALVNCTSLTDFGLAGNLLQDVPPALRLAGSLQTLDIGENRIGGLSNESFSGLGQLYGLRLVDNRVTELPHGFCDPLKRLRVLNLAQNRLARLTSTSFQGCGELRALRLDTNALEELPAYLAPQLPSLLWLNVSENRVRWADYHLLPPTIEWLDLSYNRLVNLGGLGPGSGFHLRVLDASHNNLTHLDYTTIPPTLETLRLNHNALSSLAPDTFSRATRIRRVELVGNQLETLPMAALRIPTVERDRPLPEFYLGGNPFSCDCSMEWLTRVNQLATLRQHPRILDLDAITCKQTYSRAAGVVALPDAKPADFLCPYTAHCFALCHCCEFDACDCAMTCPTNCSCFHDTAWSANIVQCSGLDYGEIPDRIPMDATEIYLDGNRLPSLGSHIFIGKKNLRVLYLNDSGVEVIRNKTFNGLRSLEILRLDRNRLSALYGYEFGDTENLRELYLQDNVIASIGPNTFSSLQFLQVLRLDGNRLIDFTAWELSGNGYLNSLRLAGNPWTCDCDFVIEFRDWIVRGAVADSGAVKCLGDGLEQSLGSLCSAPPENSLISVTPDLARDPQGPSLGSWILVLSLLGLLGLVALAGLVFRKELSLWARGQRSSAAEKCSSSSLVGDELFDAYLLYNRKDEELVGQKLVQGLSAFHLLLHYRDLGGMTSDKVHGAAESSRRVIFIVSPAFIQEELTFPETRQTLLNLMTSHPAKLVFILLPPLNEVKYPEFRGRGPVLDWTDPAFWPKLRLLLPPTEAALALSTISRGSGSQSQYARNVSLGRTNSVPVPKHHIVLPVHGTLPHGHGHTVYPAPPYFTFAENFRLHQQQQPLTFATMSHSHSHQKEGSGSSSKSYRPLLRSPMSPDSGSAEDSGHVNSYTSSRCSDGLENEHVYSTLDSPLQSPLCGGGGPMHVSYDSGGGGIPPPGNRTMYFV